MSRAARIRLVDDHPGDRLLWREAIEQVGWMATVAESSSAGDALHALRQSEVEQIPPDLRIVDYWLARRDCIPLLERIRALPAYRRLPIIVMSGTPLQATSRRRCIDLGVVKILVAFDNFDSLLPAVRILKRMLQAARDISSGGSWISEGDLAEMDGGWPGGRAPPGAARAGPQDAATRGSARRERPGLIRGLATSMTRIASPKPSRITSMFLSVGLDFCASSFCTLRSGSPVALAIW
jgi:CheY-like chemotaxis protein